MQRLTFRHRAHKVVFMLFYLNKVIFAVLDVSSLPLQKFQTSMEVFFTLIVLVPTQRTVLAILELNVE